MRQLSLIICSLLAFGSPIYAQTLVAAHHIRARSIIGPDDVALVEVDTTGGFSDVLDVLWQEAKVNLYAGRVIRPSEIGPPAILERNQIVIMLYASGNLTITSEGRVLARAGVGETVRVMNLDSKMTVTGRVMVDGSVEVMP